MTASRVAYVLGTTEGGTGRHVAMLARGCAAAGLAVCVFGPAAVADGVRRLGPAGFGPDAAGGLPGLGPAGFGPDAAGGMPGLGPAGFGPDAAGGMPGLGPVGFEAVPVGDRPRPGRDAAAVRRLRRLLAGMAPDVVHAQGVRAGGLAALALRPVARRPWTVPRRQRRGRRPAGAGTGARRPALVVTVHNAPPPGAAARAVYMLLERLVARRADVVLCVSPDLSARMSRAGAREVGRAIVPAPAPQPARVPVSEPVSASSVAPADLGAARRPVVLGVGRLSAQKGFDTLIEAAGRWRDREPVPLLAIAGIGPLADGLAARARDVGTDVRFLGWRDDVPALLAAADVFVLPSRWEGQPLVLQEALRAGRPVVAADVGGVRGLTGDAAALLVPPGDASALAAAILSVLDSPRAAARLAAAAARRAAELPTETDAIAAALALYDRLSGS